MTKVCLYCRTPAEVFLGEAEVVEEESNRRTCLAATGAELLAGDPGLLLNPALILSSFPDPPQ